MSIGLLELLFLLLVTLFVIGAMAATKGQWRWLAGIPVCVAIAVLVTPADAGSTFIVAAPYALGYLYLVSRRDQKHARESA